VPRQQAGQHGAATWYDDIESAAYNNPATVRQPLKKMGEIAARTLLNQIDNGEPRVPEITINPECAVRPPPRAPIANQSFLKLA
jgi:DNA-binding LacI/PurR family transcriptional regulator